MNHYKARVTTLMVSCFVFAGAILSRAAYIQIIRDPRLEALAKRQFHSKLLIQPRRGMILDRNNEPLAVNLEVKSLAANPSKIQNKRTLSRLLSKITEIPLNKLYDRLKGEKEFVWIKRHLTDAEMAKLKKYGIIGADGELMAGLWMVQENKRVYPNGELASHVLGSVNLDTEGLEGVELWANTELQGKVVSVSAVKDALGRPTFIDAMAAQNVKDGESVVLSLDASLQYSASQELRNAVIKSGARGGSVMVMNAVTGEILAMANEPSFNPNEKGATPARRRNRVLTDGYEPGSTMKPLLLASALSHGFKLTDQLHGENGSFVVQGKRISEAETHEKFEFITLKKIIQVSSNVGAAKLALKLGADHYLNTLKALEFGTKTGVGFPGEISGKVPPRKTWQPLTLANIGFGQGILVTPIQMLRSYAALANGGWLVQPTLLKSSLKSLNPRPPKRVFTAKVTEGVTEALKTVTQEGGTGIKAAVEGYVVAGKTGTAQMVDPGTGKYSRSNYVASFIGYPVGIEPKLVIFTSIEAPRGIYYASETAAPLFSAVLTAATNRFSLPKTEDIPARTVAQMNHAPSPISDKLHWSLAKVVEPEAAPEPKMEWQGTAQDGGLIWKMPSLHGMTPREAIQVLKGHKFELEVQGNGIIKTQVPEIGKAVADGATIKLTLAEP